MLCTEFDLTYRNDRDQVNESHSLCDPGICTERNQISSTSTLNSENAVEIIPSTLYRRWEIMESDEISLLLIESDENKSNVKDKPWLKISPHDFKKLDFPDPRWCASCGKQGVSWFIGTGPTPRRRNNLSIKPYALCQSCWQNAFRIETDRCSICNLGKVVWGWSAPWYEGLWVLLSLWGITSCLTINNLKFINRLKFQNDFHGNHPWPPAVMQNR